MGGTPFKRFLQIVPPFLESWNTCPTSWPPNLAICWPCKRHGVSEVFSTSMALSKRLSTSLEDGSEAGQPVTQPVLPTRRCSTESSAGILISQRWPFSSVRSKKELMLSVSHCSTREASANRRPSRLHWRNNRSSAAHPARTAHGQVAEPCLTGARSD